MKDAGEPVTKYEMPEPHQQGRFFHEKKPM